MSLIHPDMKYCASTIHDRWNVLRGPEGRGQVPQNCWDVMQCGLGPGQSGGSGAGTCPAALEERLDGCNDGVNAGRACWVVAGTLCGGEPQGRFAEKVGGCMECDFYRRVKHEQGPDYLSSAALLKRLT
jgi:hypothetical protein